MRFFHVASSEGGAFAIIYHHYLDGQYYCRTRSDSFRRSFNEVSGRILHRFVRENRNLFAYPLTPYDYGWIEAVLEEVCRGSWKYRELESSEVTGSFDDLVEKYLSK